MEILLDVSHHAKRVQSCLEWSWRDLYDHYCGEWMSGFNYGILFVYISEAKHYGLVSEDEAEMLKAVARQINKQMMEE